MAAQQDPRYSSSEEEILDAPDEIPHMEGLISPHQGEDLTAPATRDIKTLMHNIRVFFNADLNIIREDITVVTARVQATEDSIHSITQQQTSTNEPMQQLLATNKVMQIRIDTLDDARRCKNLKIRGITETIGEQKLPHLIRLHLPTLLPQRSAGGIQIDGCFRFAKSSRAPAGTP
ncbi:Hypothetical predicted protein [Pelobates cultripes]|uniref:Uncharacterized protein n=1 Tax=Pelobates cultripes TaxID=61616 RepID=A0AAD1QZ71_PELCU|nr:Hypothetical predicted protein [Pelobates cultripes]